MISQVFSLDNSYQFQLTSLGNKNHQAVNGTFRNINPFKTHRSFHSQTRGVFWEEKKKKTAKINTYESWWNTEPGQVWRIENKHGNSLTWAEISFCAVSLHTIYRKTPECHSDRVTFNFGIGSPPIQPSPEGLVVILCTLLGTEVQAVFTTRVNVAQFVDTARSWTELATILRPKNRIQEF